MFFFAVGSPVKSKRRHGVSFWFVFLGILIFNKKRYESTLTQEEGEGESRKRDGL